ncbi:NAD(P)-binding protein [Daldinia caldariorum]|uniref:NAD(P)-binding protein n=1 Tax=Daldinia caldariorum TaxID=326644 RepID=UPI00200871FA|nr:NAD(P)-binding protein [Daldinia caldariorum]KAI1467747.1 NAD(P)-binding protein [Daldinia caldariorum]
MNINGHALIVGGGSGIGEACAFAFAQEGAAGIVVADIDLEAAERVVKKSSASALTANFKAKAVEVDVTSDDSVKRAIEETVAFFGRIDYCVNCAGIGVQAAKGISEADVSEFERFMRVNATGTFLVTRYVYAAMKSQELTAASARTPSKRGSTRGSIVNLGSLASYISQPHMVQYTASKHAVLGVTKNAAMDNAVHAIRVNCLCPSWVDTPMVQQAMDSVPGLKEMIERAIPIGRIVCPEEVADAAIFLCSPRSSYITGSSFIVDGGTSLASKL